MDGYKKFLEYVKDLIPQATPEELALAGVPLNAIRQLSSLSWREYHKLNRKICQNPQEIVRRRKQLIKEWYSKTFEAHEKQSTIKPTAITLEMFLETYREDGLFAHPNEIFDSLSELYNLGYHFPYTPKHRDAYLAALITFTGHIDRNSYSVEIQADKEDLENVVNKLDLRGKIVPSKYGYRRLRLPASLGRLFMLLDVPVGDKMETEFKLPSWISRDYLGEYLAGLLDSRLYINSHIQLKFYRQENTIGFLEHIKNILDDFGISANVRYYHSKRPNRIEGVVSLSGRDKLNLERVLQLPLKFPSKIRKLKEEILR
ncbi:MAG: hypothetical protein QW818_03845 [Candidatus Aenigmatarchaeota archaeon]|nr:hypothetical protein [Candidatus Aenigmarchaeota archaeon]